MDNQPGAEKSRENRVTRNVIFVVAIVLFIIGGVLSVMDKTASAGSAYAAGFSCLFFVFLPEFKKFKGFGVEAELLEKKIEEADEVLQRLRSLSVPIAEILFTVVARMGRWDSMVPRRDRYRIMTQIEEELRRNGVSREQLETAKREWHRFNMIDHARPLINEASELAKQKVSEKEAVISAFRQPINAGDPTYTRAIDEFKAAQAAQGAIVRLYFVEEFDKLPGMLEDTINSCPLFNTQEKRDLLAKHAARLEDLHHYARYHEFRRLEAWLAEEDK